MMAAGTTALGFFLNLSQMGKKEMQTGKADNPVALFTVGELVPSPPYKAVATRMAGNPRS